MNDPCWKGYKMVGTKKKNGKEVPNCVGEEAPPATSIGNKSVAMPPGYKAPQVMVDRRRRKDQPPVMLKRFRKYSQD